jgi:hypothetical protein
MQRKQLQNAVVILGIALLFAIGLKWKKQDTRQPIAERPPIERPLPPEPEPPRTPDTPNINNPTPAYLDYDGIVEKIKEWNQSAPDLTEVGTYGESTRGKKLWYIRVTNKLSLEKAMMVKNPDFPRLGQEIQSYLVNQNNPRKVVLITASIHGNEPWSTGCVMAYIGNMLKSYGQDDEITNLIDTRDIYFVPVISPDSYPHSRHVDGVDPNRNFPGPRSNNTSVPPVKAIQDLFTKIKPNAVISGHTFGRIYLYPFGDDMDRCPNDSDYQKIIGEMSRLSRYRMDRACNMYNRPIYGSEVDWYYRHGAMAIVMEFGTHQQRPSLSDITSEFDRTYKAVLHFIKEAPEVQIIQQ